MLTFRTKEQRYAEFVRSAAHESGQLLADAWCAAFVCKKTKALDFPITERIFRDIERNPHSVPPWLKEEILQLSRHYRFFHWHLSFPEVFRPTKLAPDASGNTGWDGGFDLVLGNPPWDALSPDAKEFFSAYDSQVRFQDKSGQEQIIDGLLESPTIRAQWDTYCRDLYSSVLFFKESGRFRLYAPGNLGKGDFNVFRMFVEAALDLCADGRFAAQIVPEGLYNGANCMAIRQRLFDRFTLKTLLCFENAKEVWFKDVDSRAKFCLYSVRKGGKTISFGAAFNIRSEADLAAAFSGDALQIPVSVVHRFSPEALAVPELTSQREIDLAAKMYSRCPTFGDDSLGPPHHTYMAEVHTGNDRDLFRDDANGLPVYEGRMIDHFDHRAKAYISGRGRSAVWKELPFELDEKAIKPQWHVAEDEVPAKARERVKRYRVGFCNVGSPTNERTLCAAVIPPKTICGDTVPTFTLDDGYDWYALVWVAIANTFAMDFLVRQKAALHLTNTLVDSMPFPRLSAESNLSRELVVRSLLLSCTSPEMETLWRSLAANGWTDSSIESRYSIPVHDADVRAALMAENEAIVAHEVYGLSRDDLDYIMETFPIVKRKDIAKYGTYRTKERILAAYDRMTASLSIRRRVEVPTLRACELLALILDEWNKPVQRQAADRALILAR